MTHLYFRRHRKARNVRLRTTDAPESLPRLLRLRTLTNSVLVPHPTPTIIPCLDMQVRHLPDRSNRHPKISFFDAKKKLKWSLPQPQRLERT